MRPCAACPEDNIVYVKGKISNAGMLYNLGVTLVAEEGYPHAAAAEYSGSTRLSVPRSAYRVQQLSSHQSEPVHRRNHNHIELNISVRHGHVRPWRDQNHRKLGNQRNLVSAGNASDPYYEKVPAVANRVKGGKVTHQTEQRKQLCCSVRPRGK
ncbi:MAG: hypothetical protein R2688_04095 [Fimbriimonadaceae bacterium]